MSNTRSDAAREEFERHFDHVQLMRVWMEDGSDQVNVKAYSIKLRTSGHIPIKLGLVMGDFSCAGRELESLQNAPHTVTGNFTCHHNQLSSLVGGPHNVGSNNLGGGSYSCAVNNLHSFEGAPTTFTGYFIGVQQRDNSLTSLKGLPPESRLVEIPYQPDLPLLRLLDCKRIIVRSETDERHPTSDILEPYMGKGKPGAIKAAVDLIRAGYKGNAKW